MMGPVLLEKTSQRHLALPPEAQQPQAPFPSLWEALRTAGAGGRAGRERAPGWAPPVSTAEMTINSNSSYFLSLDRIVHHT